MYERTTSQGTASIPTWETLHEWLREQAQGLIQKVLEAEVTELLGRARYQRRAEVDGAPGYRNGYGKPRKLSTPLGMVTLRRPRVRGLEERFVSRILPLFARRTKEVGELLPELYLHGLAEGDFDLALRGLLGEDAPLSASTVARLKEQWQAEWEMWRKRRLDDLEPVYVWADGVPVAGWAGGGDLEDAPGGGTAFPTPECPAPAREGLRGRAVRGWDRGSQGGRRLMRKSTSLDGTSGPGGGAVQQPPVRRRAPAH